MDRIRISSTAANAGMSINTAQGLRALHSRIRSWQVLRKPCSRCSSFFLGEE